MYLKPIFAVLLAAAGLGTALTPALGQSLSPMRSEGTTPTGMKAFRLQIGNPYRQRMVFIIVPMEPGFETPAAGAKVNYPEIVLAPGASRQVIVSFSIDPAIKERTIGVCVQPKAFEGTVLPRVCGTFTGRISGAGG